jgi:serine/threonine protein phosphatase PrpC
MIDALTHPGFVRPSNQDAVLAEALPGGVLLLAVADGVGGYPGGEVASRLAIETLRDSMRGRPLDDPAASLVRTFEEAHARIRSEQTGEHEWMSTTLVAAVVSGLTAWVANVGDCRAYIGSGGGELRQVTRDHSWVEEQMRAGRLQADDPLVAAARHLITRSVGAEASVEVDRFGPLALAEGDTLLLCSDGLHGPVPDDAIAEALQLPGEEAAEQLVQAALAHGGPDNIGVALYRA